MENVIALTFETREQAREAVTALLELHRSSQLRLEAAAVVERNDEGRVVALQHAETSGLRGTAGGGVIGGLIGLLTGPVGVLVGGATGAVVGSLVDLADTESSEDLLRWLARMVPRDRAAVLAVADEPTPAPLDALASEHGAIVHRRDRASVEHEILEAEEDALDAARKSVGTKRPQ